MMMFIQDSACGPGLDARGYSCWFCCAISVAAEHLISWLCHALFIQPFVIGQLNLCLLFK